jgi:PAS domain S-box-containing protein
VSEKPSLSAAVEETSVAAGMQKSGQSLELGGKDSTAQTRPETGKQSQLALQGDAEAKFRQLAESIGDVFWMTDLEKNQTLYISPAYAEIWGRSCESLYESPRNWMEAIHPEDRPHVLRASLTKQVLGQYNEIYRIVRPDGAVRWIQDRAFPIRDQSGKVCQIAGVAEDITHRKEVEEWLRQSEARKRAVMESAPDAIVTIDHEGRIIEFNAAAEKMLGYARTRVLGKELAEVMIPPSVGEEQVHGLGSYLASGTSGMVGKVVETTAMRADGTEFPVETTVTRMDVDGAAIFTAFIRDVTERKITERRLAAQQAVMRALAESATLDEGTAAILRAVCERLGWEMGVLWEVQWASKRLRCLDLWAIPALAAHESVNDIRSRTFSRGEGLAGRVWFYARAAWIPNLLIDRNAIGGPWAVECGLRGAFGFPILFQNRVIGILEFFSREIREPDKPLVEMLSALGGQIGQFIARKQSEEALREAEAKYRSIFENSIEGIFQSTPNGRYLSANSALARMLGYSSPEELIAATTDIATQVCVNAQTRIELKRRLESEGSVRDYENQIYHRDGSVRWTSISARVVRDSRGSILYYEGTSQDITERKRAEARLAILAQALEGTAEMICITDLQDRFTFTNRAFLQGYGYSEAEILGKTPEILFSPKNPASLMAEILTQTRLGGWRGEVIDKRKDGSEFPVRLSTSLIKDADGQVIGLIGVAQDITQQKKAEKEKAALGELSHKLSGASTPEEAAQIIIAIADELFQIESGYIHLYSPAEDKLVPVLTFDTINGRRSPVLSSTFTLDPSPAMRQVMEQGAQLLNRTDIPGGDAGGLVPLRNQAGFPSQVELVPFGNSTRRSASLMYVPIHSREGVLGILSVQSYTPDSYSSGDLRLLQTLADHCGEALGRIKVARELRQTEEKYHAIFDNATEGIFQTTPEGRYLSANPALAKMFGYRSAEELMASVTDIEHQTYASPARREELKRDLEQRGSVRGFEAERLRKDGSKFWISINARIVRDVNGAVLYYEGTNQDITARKTAERVLRESEEKFRTLFESARAGIALHGADGHLLLSNPAYQRMLGYGAEEMSKLGVKRFTHPEDVAEGQRLFVELREGKRDHYVREKRYLHKSGRVVWGQASASAIRTDGQLQYIMSMVEDITERKHAEEALRESERKLRLIAENTTDVIFAFDMARQPLYVNQAVEKLTGYTFAEIHERKFINWIHPEDQVRMLRLWEELYAGGAYADEEFRLITKTGELKWCTSSWGPLLDEQGVQVGVQGRERDITELKRADAARRELAAIVENSGSAIVSASLEGLVVSWNKAAERLFGYAANEIIGQPVWSLYPPSATNVFRETLPALLEGGRIDGYETVRVRKDGSLVEVALTVSPVRDVARNITGISAIVEDITERKLLEKELLEISAKERRALGHELHDGLGQYMAGIALKTKALEEDLAAEGSALQHKAKQLVRLMNDAIHQTRGLAQGLDPVHVEANGLVAALRNLAAQTEDLFRVTCEFNCLQERMELNAATGLAFYRISQEAIHNAVKHGRARRLELDLRLDETSLCLKIRDDGSGFHTSAKAVSGLGLRTMRYRANSIGGTLRVDSEPERGTQIECVVPRNAIG